MDRITHSWYSKRFSEAGNTPISKGVFEAAVDEVLTILSLSSVGLGICVFALYADLRVYDFFISAPNCVGLQVLLCEFFELPLSTFFIVAPGFLLVSIEVLKWLTDLLGRRKSWARFKIRIKYKFYMLKERLNAQWMN